MPLGKEETRHIARLARLNFTDNEIEKLTRELAVIVDYFEQLQEIYTTGVEPRDQFIQAENVLREDSARPSLPRDAALANAPQTDGEFFLVPKVIG